MTITIRFPFPGSIRVFQVVCFSFDSLFLAAICKCSVLNTSPSSELPGNNISSLCSSAWSLVSGTWNMNKTSLCALISNSTPQTHSSVPKVETLWRPNEDADNQRSRRRLISKQKKDNIRVVRRTEEEREAVREREFSSRSRSPDTPRRGGRIEEGLGRDERFSGLLLTPS